MSNIRIRRSRFASPEGWEMDCFVFPNDEINGELVHFKPNKILEFKQVAEPGLFAALESLLDRIPSGSDISKTDVRVVLGWLKNGEKTYYSLKALDQYIEKSPEAELWALVNSIFEKRTKGL